MAHARNRISAVNFGTGISWADPTARKHGDDKRLAFLYFADLKLDVRDDCPEDLRDIIIADAAEIQARRGEEYQVSISGQTITLGHALPSLATPSGP